MESKTLVDSYECTLIDDFIWVWFTLFSVLVSVCVILVSGTLTWFKVGRRIVAKSALLFTAHPDDEVMFFGPTLIDLKKSGCDVRIVCLSVGDHEGQGDKRVKELFECTEYLGVPSDKVLIINDSRLKDGPNEIWPMEHLSNIISEYIETLEPEVVLSFDLSGVSSHPNHIALSVALISLKVNTKTVIYQLKTVNVVRKYLSFFDTIISLFCSDILITISFCDYLTLVRAMSRHTSQFVWFRRLYVIFSRYMFMNSFKKLH